MLTTAVPGLLMLDLASRVHIQGAMCPRESPPEVTYIYIYINIYTYIYIYVYTYIEREGDTK